MDTTELQTSCNIQESQYKATDRRQSYEACNEYREEYRSSCNDAGCFLGFAGFKPVTANAAQAAMPATASLEEENSYFEEDAYQRSFLTLINNERAKAGLAPCCSGRQQPQLPLQWSVPKSWQFLTLRSSQRSARFHRSGRERYRRCVHRRELHGRLLHPPIPQWISG